MGTKRNRTATATFKHPSKRRLEKVIRAIEGHLEEHPNNGVAQKHLNKLQTKLNTNTQWQEG